MNKKQIRALLDSIIESVQSRMNDDTTAEVTEDEARTLVGLHLRVNRAALLDAIVPAPAAPVVTETAE
jgi:hypothetical protein